MLEKTIERLRQYKPLNFFTWSLRVLLAIGFIPSGYTKLVGNPFTVLSPDTSIGYFFDALFKTGFYYQFIGGCQLISSALLLIPRTTTLGALLFISIITNIFVLTVSLHFRGTPIITGLMFLGGLYLVVWDYKKIRPLIES